MTHCDAGDIVLVRFPFTDLRSTKRRPALVLSPQEFSTLHGDVVVLALTGQKQKQDEFLLRQWQAAKLLKPTWIKPLIATISSSIVERRLGTLHDDDWATAKQALRSLLSSRFLSPA